MKCNNCGANFQTADLKCPYCGAQNTIGYEWQKERNWYKNLYEKTLHDVKMYGPLYVANSIINKALIILAIVSAVILLIYLVPAIGQEASVGFGKIFMGNHIEKQLKEYQESGDWESLRLMVDEYNLYGSDYYDFTQAAILQRTYNKYQMTKMQFMDLSEEEKQEDDYYLYQSIRESANVYSVNCGIYDELSKSNEPKVEEYRQEILVYWKYMLGMTDEEIDYILKEEYLSSDEVEELTAKIKERKAWQ